MMSRVRWLEYANFHSQIDNANGHLDVCNRYEWCGAGGRKLFYDIKVQINPFQ